MLKVSMIYILEKHEMKYVEKMKAFQFKGLKYLAHFI